MFTKEKITLYLKGFAMGTADIVPGVSGGTIALIAGIYEELVKTISSFDHKFVKTLFTFDLKKIFEAGNFKFLIPLGIGIVSAILIMARVMHYLLEHHPVYTWSLFFGLIIASIFFIMKTIGNLKDIKNILAIVAGTGIGYLVTSSIPVNTPETYGFVFFSGMIAICAMILPGISGSFILLILGKYFFITGMLKNPFANDHLIFIGVFCMGCLIGITSFSKLLNYLLEKFHDLTMCVLIGFMIGSLKKIWPWREADQVKVVGEKTKVLTEKLFFPAEINTEFFLAIVIMIVGFSMVFILERKNS